MSEVRCKNCLKRFKIPLNDKVAACPNCQTKFRISWPRPNQAMIRGLAES